MELTELALEKLKDEPTRMRLCLRLGIGYFTLNRWISKNYKSLFNMTTLKAISEETGIDQGELIKQ